MDQTSRAGAAPVTSYKIEQLQDHRGKVIFPQTTSEAVIGALRPFGPISVTIPAAGWTAAAPYTQTVAVEGVTADMDHLGLYMADVADATARKAYETAFSALAAEFETVDGGIVLTCREKKPAIDLTVLLRGVC